MLKLIYYYLLEFARQRSPPQSALINIYIYIKLQHNPYDYYTERENGGKSLIRFYFEEGKKEEWMQYLTQ